MDDPGDAEAAAVYGQWADLLYLKVACLFLGVALADLALWAANGSVANLVGPGSFLIVCLAYLNRRRRFRRAARLTVHRAGSADRGRWFEQPDSGPADRCYDHGGYKLSA